MIRLNLPCWVFRLAVATVLVVSVATSGSVWAGTDKYRTSCGFVAPCGSSGIRSRGIALFSNNRGRVVDIRGKSLRSCFSDHVEGRGEHLSQNVLGLNDHMTMGFRLARLPLKHGNSRGVSRDTRGVDSLSATSVLLHDEPIFFGGRQPITSRAVEWFLTRSIQSRAKASSGLFVEVEARSNRAAMSGQWDTVAVQFDKLAFDNIQVTGGARLEVLGVDMFTFGLLPGPMRRLRRLRRPCEVTGSYILMDADLMASPAIRRLAETVLNTAFKPLQSRKGDTDQLVDRIKVFRVRVRGGKITVQGEMSSEHFYMPFRCDTGLSTSRDGHVLYLKDPEVFWDAPVGHVPLPMPTLHNVDIDLGDRARIERLRINRGRISIQGRFVLSPVAPLTVSPVSKRGKLKHDLGESLSRITSRILGLRRR
ncbi:unnamed protein product [Choristocarpus tenellus]